MASQRNSHKRHLGFLRSIVPISKSACRWTKIDVAILFLSYAGVEVASRHVGLIAGSRLFHQQVVHVSGFRRTAIDSVPA